VSSLGARAMGTHGSWVSIGLLSGNTDLLAVPHQRYCEAGVARQGAEGQLVRQSARSTSRGQAAGPRLGTALPPRAHPAQMWYFRRGEVVRRPV
jgi:hypothetical protein